MMKKIVVSIFLAAGLLSFTGCTSSTSDIQVESQVGEKVNLEGYKTYDWLVSADVVIDKNDAYKGRDYDVNAYIESQVNKALLNSNRNEDKIQPDFFVSYVIGVNMDLLKEKVDAEGQEYLENIPKAALAVILIDSHTKKIIWAASASANINQDLSDEESKKRIRYAVEKMFSNF